MAARVAKRASKSQAQKAEGNKGKGGNAAVPPKKQLVKLFIKKKDNETLKTPKDKPEQVIVTDGETKIGWFRYSEATEIVSDDEGKMVAIFRRRWTKIPTPEDSKYKVTRST